MATQEVIDGLTQTIQDCLEAKLQAGFDAQAALTVDIAREIAGAIETKANTYTDIEISKVTTLIESNEVDLGPFTEFMNTLSTLLDGDETTEGYQIFNTLITDTTANSTLLASHVTTIQTIQSTLTTFQSTLADHETRIAALEAGQHEAMDCEECHDAILTIVDDSMESACTAADVANAAHFTANAASTLADFAQRVDPISISCEVDYDEVTEELAITGEFTGRKVDEVGCEVGSGSVDPNDTGLATLDKKTKKFRWVYPGNSNNARGKSISCRARDKNGNDLGFSAVVNFN